jgi:hypothetical protein
MYMYSPYIIMLAETEDHRIDYIKGQQEAL